jgi:type IV pilus assembly protein PilX
MQGLPARQGGFALVLGLILILVMTVFSVFAMNGSILQERMAGNQRDYKIAFEASEMGLRWGEAWLQSRTPITRPFPCQTLVKDGSQNCNNPRQVLDGNLLGYALEDQDPWKGANEWVPDNAREYGIDPDTNAATTPAYTIAGVARQPLILMEQAFVDRDDLAGNPQQGRVFYRVIAAGNGARQSTITIGESAVAKRYE